MKFIGFDLGGTKLSSAVINSNGKILSIQKEASYVDRGWESVKKQISKLTQEYISKYSDIRGVGVASAGPLHAKEGILLDPTNFIKNGKTWGRVNLVKDLQKELGLPVFLENDAAAAVLAEHWIGTAKKKKNIVMLTLGTGLGVGVICNGELVCGGRGLHPEGGHIIIDMQDRLVRCGCGNYGCAEAFLSGKKFEERAKIILKNDDISIREILAAANVRKKEYLFLFDVYAEKMALALHNFCVLYYPEQIVFSGGFSHATPFFLPKVKKNLKGLLSRRLKSLPIMPELLVSKLQEEIGVIGGAYLVKMNLIKNRR